MESVQDTIVLKFGSSVLPDEDHVAHAVHEIYRHVRRGTRVIAVVSAIGSTTDALLAHARRYGADADPVGVAALAATGEATATALLTLALDRAGVPANALDAGAIGLNTSGGAADASPTAVDVAAIRRALEDREVLVVPGFVGRDELGRQTLLGRGGSDFTAAYIAAALGCECILVKDVDALYDRDPAEDPTNARRLREASYGDVLALSEGIVQHKAVRFVKERGVRVSIACVGRDTGTVIHAGPTRHGEQGAAAGRAPLRVALLGLGTVGLGVYDHLRRLPQLFDIRAIAVRRPEGRGGFDDAALLTGDAVGAAREDAEIVIEALGGIEPARAAIVAALTRGASVVTANKAVVAAHLEEFRGLEAAFGGSLAYSAAVGGGVPVLERVRRIAQGHAIREVRAVLNGTTNFVLDRLHQGVAFDVAVGEAQAAGFAEADPSTDLEGIDAAQKLSLIAREAFGVALPVSRIERTGIRGLSRSDAAKAAAEGCCLRLVATLRRSGATILASVEPRRVEHGDPLASRVAEGNSVVVTTASGRTFTLRGRGAGRYPTAESVMGDVLEAARARRGAGRKEAVR